MQKPWGDYLGSEQNLGSSGKLRFHTFKIFALQEVIEKLVTMKEIIGCTFVDLEKA